MNSVISIVSSSSPVEVWANVDGVPSRLKPAEALAEALAPGTLADALANTGGKDGNDGNG